MVVPNPATPAPAPDELHRDALRQVRQDTGLSYAIATSLTEVAEAWGLVYRSYRRSGLIDENPHELHTVPRAVGPQTVVVYGRIGPIVASTLSAYLDGPAGLPVDSLYGEELAELRSRGRGLCEVGLFADRRKHLSRSANSLFELMRYAFFHAVHGGADDIVIAVHPRHAPFYQRLIGFEVAGEERSYELVNDHPAVLLRLDVRRWSEGDRRAPRGLRYFHANPVPAEAYAQRFGFEPDAVAGSPLAAFAPHAGAEPAGPPMG